jgi:Protein of unknown function (DUF4240)
MSWKMNLANLFDSPEKQDSRFWQLLADCHGAAMLAGREGTLGEFDDLIKRLRLAGRREIRKFVSWRHKMHIEAYRHDLWNAIKFFDDGCSDDAFSEFREWLIWQGRKVFEEVVLQPDELADYLQSLDMTVVGHLGNFWTAVCKAYSGDGTAFSGALKLSRIHLEFPAEPAGDPTHLSESESALRFPKLAALKLAREAAELS